MSNKTQLQTNNSKLSALITELQGKAAGGGSGGMQIVSGAFMPSSTTAMVTVSGIPFRPTMIVYCLAGTATVTSSTKTQYQIVSCLYDEDSMDYPLSNMLTNSGNYGRVLKFQSSATTNFAVPTDDGFTITPTSSFMISSSAYYYVAAR